MSEYVQRVENGSTLLSPSLAHLDIELTERCNNDCIHCCINLPLDDAAARSREMKTEQVKDILRQAADLGCLQVRYTGGEPLLRPDFEELYLFARSLGLKVLVFTNARLITARLAGLFARVPPLVPIEITVYGMHEYSYESVTRSQGSFAQFWHGVELLLEHSVPFVVKGTLLPPNRDELGEFEAWAQTIPTMERRPGLSMFYELRGRRDDDAKNELIKSLRVSPQEGLKIVSRDEARFYQEMAEFRTKFMGVPDDRLFTCGAGHGLSIDAYGIAQPCLGLRASELTVDTRVLSLAEVLDRFASLGGLRATNPDYLRRCARCFLKGLCEQCPARSWSEHGTLDTPVEYYCAVAHAQARFLGWLAEGEMAWKVKQSRDMVDE
ncbi:MAG: radical SAM protein [Thermoleophilia bacterium]|nr:radical SAM protein [Thermoleophilia bacterium]